jgi:hypothetical protein
MGQCDCAIKQRPTKQPRKGLRCRHFCCHCNHKKCSAWCTTHTCGYNNRETASPQVPQDIAQVMDSSLCRMTCACRRLSTLTGPQGIVLEAVWESLRNLRRLDVLLTRLQDLQATLSRTRMAQALSLTVRTNSLYKSGTTILYEAVQAAHMPLVTWLLDVGVCVHKGFTETEEWRHGLCMTP